jgi:hypothetical protein
MESIHAMRVELTEMSWTPPLRGGWTSACRDVPLLRRDDDSAGMLV